MCLSTRWEDNLSHFFSTHKHISGEEHTHDTTHTHRRGSFISQSDAVCVGKWNELWKARLSVFIIVFIFPPRSESRRPSPPRCSHYALRSWTVFDYQINISYFVVFVFTSQSGGSLLDLLKGQFNITGKGAYLLFHGVMMTLSLLSVKAVVLNIFITTAAHIAVWKGATRSANIVSWF